MKLDTLFENFGMLSDTPNGIPKMREMILQLAVQGNLAPQNPNDEPASVLLEKIKDEKERLIKENIIRKTKPLQQLIPEKMPYELPDGWIWASMADVFDVRDGTHDTPKYVSEGFPLITSKNIYGGMLDFSNVNYISPKDHQKIQARSLVEKYDILFAMIGSIGNPVIVNTNEQFSIKNVALFKYYSKQLSNPEYLLIFLKHASEKMRNESAGGVQSFVSLTFLRNYPFPLPPLNEQKRIVAIVDRLIPLCNDLEAQKKKRDESRIVLNDASLDKLLSSKDQKDFDKHWYHIRSNFDLLYDNPENVDKLRQAILQLAVQGKLVPQDFSDEPASALLDKINAEKEDLIAVGKIKKPKPLPSVKPDEAPYGLPESWEWVRLGDITSYGITEKVESGGVVEGTWTLVLENIEKTSSKLLVRVRYPEKDFKSTKNVFRKGDVLYGKLRPYLDKVLVADEAGVCTTEIMPIRGYCEIDPFYLRYALKTPNFISYANSMTHGMNLPRLGTDKARSALLPLPPFAEQKRIVAKIDTLVALCGELETKISQSKSDCDELLTEIVNNNGDRKAQVSNKNKTGRMQRKKSDRQKKTKSTKTTESEDSEHAPQGDPNRTKLTTQQVKYKTKAPLKTELRFDKQDVLKAYRKAIFRQNGIDELTLLRLTGQRLAVKKLSQRIREELESYLKTGVRRKILYRNDDGYCAGAPTIEYYEDDFLIKVLRSVIKKGWEYPRDHLVDEAASYLGFDKASEAFKERLKSVFRKAIRNNSLYRNGQYVGKM